MMKLASSIFLIIILVVVLRLGELFTQLGRYQRYWDRVNQSPISADELVYVAFGDSAAQGIGASRPDKGYVGLIASRLASVQNRPVRIINFSKSGATIGDVLDTQLPKYERLKLQNQQIITVDVGANDVVRTDLTDFETDMDKLMSALPQQVLIAEVPSFKGSRYARLEPRVKRANEIMHKLANKHGFRLVSIHDNMNGKTGPRVFAADYFHPSDYGYKVNWADVFWQRISQEKGL